MNEINIYNECKRAGIPTDNHYSDLYIPFTPMTEALVRESNIKGITVFTNQVKGGLWYDIPFMFTPYFETRKKGI